jgi:hypothetical protein
VIDQASHSTLRGALDVGRSRFNLFIVSYFHGINPQWLATCGEIMWEKKGTDCICALPSSAQQKTSRQRLPAPCPLPPRKLHNRRPRGRRRKGSINPMRHDSIYSGSSFFVNRDCLTRQLRTTLGNRSQVALCRSYRKGNRSAICALNPFNTMRDVLSV